MFKTFSNKTTCINNLVFNNSNNSKPTETTLIKVSKVV